MCIAAPTLISSGQIYISPTGWQPSFQEHIQNLEIIFPKKCRLLDVVDVTGRATSTCIDDGSIYYILLHGYETLTGLPTSSVVGIGVLLDRAVLPEADERHTGTGSA